jgi:hypothetical protein
MVIMSNHFNREFKEAIVTDADVIGRTFLFGRIDGSHIGILTMRENGRIEGYSHQNERSWIINDEGHLCFCDRRRKVTTEFRRVDPYKRAWGDFEGRLSWHCLRELDQIPQKFDGNRLELGNVTLVCVDCHDVKRAIKSLEICKYYCNFGSVKLFSSMKSGHRDAVNIPDIRSLYEYSRFMIKNLAAYIETDYLLVVQHDGFVCNPNAWCAEWYDYDYVGGKVPYDVDFWRGIKYGGCGGFSFRSRRLQEYMSAHCDWESIDPKRHHEDFVICSTFGYQLGSSGFKLYPAELAPWKFSGEETLPYQGQFGHHKANLAPWKIRPSFA